MPRIVIEVRRYCCFNQWEEYLECCFVLLLRSWFYWLGTDCVSYACPLIYILTIRITSNIRIFLLKFCWLLSVLRFIYLGFIWNHLEIWCLNLVFILQLRFNAIFCVWILPNCPKYVHCLIFAMVFYRILLGIY